MTDEAPDFIPDDQVLSYGETGARAPAGDKDKAPDFIPDEHVAAHAAAPEFIPDDHPAAQGTQLPGTLITLSPEVTGGAPVDTSSLPNDFKSPANNVEPTPTTNMDRAMREAAVDNAYDLAAPPIEKLLQGEVGVARGALKVAALPVEALAGAAARVSSAADVGTAYIMGDDQRPNTLGRMWDEFVNPATLKAFRAGEGLPENLGDILAQQPDWRYKVGTIANEITPQGFFPSDAIDPQNLDELTSLITKDPGYEDAAKGALKFAINTGTDPMMWVSLFAKVPPEFRQAMVDAGVDGVHPDGFTANGDPYKNVSPGGGEFGQKFASPQAGGLGPEAQRGERAFLQVVPPGSRTPVAIIKGQPIMDLMDTLGSAIESKLPIRPFMQNSGLSRADAMFDLHDIKSATNADMIDSAKQMLNADTPANEAVVRHATNLANHGYEIEQTPTGIKIGGEGPALSKAQGINLTPEQMEESRRLALNYQHVNEMGNQELAAQGGKDFSAQPNLKPSPEEQEKYLAEQQKMYGPIPRVMVTDGDATFDVTFSGGKNAFYSPRELTQEAVKARELNLASQNLQSGAARRGFKVTPNSSMARAELSTPAMNEVLGRLYDVAEPFNPNQTEVVINSLKNKLDAARKLQLYNSIKDTYGVAEEAIPDAIELATNNVREAQLMGKSPSLDDLTISRMSTKDFRQIKGGAFDSIKPFQNQEGDTFLKEKQLFYPKQVADRVEAAMWQPSQNKILQQIAWLQKTFTGNALTGALRLPGRAVSNAFKALQTRTNPLDIIHEAMLATQEAGEVPRDRISQLADSIPAISNTAFDLPELQQRIGVSTKMITDPEVNAGVNAFYEALHNAAQGGQVDKALGQKVTLNWLKNLPGNMASAAKNSVEYAASTNPISSFFKKVGSSSEGLFKRAYFRTLMNDGYDVNEATRMVGDTFGNFDRTTGTVRAMRYVNPFASFMMKNLETMGRLIALRPGVVNIVNPYDGTLKKAIEEYSGWSPGDYQKWQRLLPIFRNPILGPVLRGTKELIAEGNQDKVLHGLNQYFEMGLDGDQKKSLAERGLQMSLKLPSNIQMASDMFNPARANENVSSPFYAAALAGIAGYDPFTGKVLDTMGTPMSARDRIIAAAQHLNPVNYPTFYNKVVAPILDKALPQWRQSMRDGPISSDLAKVLKLQLGSDVGVDKMKLSKDTIDTLTDVKFGKLAHMTDADMTFFTHQLGLMRTLDQTEQLIDPKFTKEGKEQGLRVIGNMKAIIDNINLNTKIYKDYKAKAQTLNLLSPDARQLLENDESADDQVPVPADNTSEDSEELDEPDNTQEEQDTPPYGRRPQSVDVGVDPMGQVQMNHSPGSPDQNAVPLQGIQGMYGSEMQHIMQKRGGRPLNRMEQQLLQQMLYKRINQPRDPRDYNRPEHEMGPMRTQGPMPASE